MILLFNKNYLYWIDNLFYIQNFNLGQTHIIALIVQIKQKQNLHNKFSYYSL